MEGIAGKVAIVTGAASGIGAGVVKRLSMLGCRVVATDLPGPGLAAVADPGDAGVLAHAADLRSNADIDALVAASLALSVSLRWPRSSTTQRSSSMVSRRPLLADVTDSRLSSLDRMKTLRALIESALSRSTKKTRLPSRDDWNTPGATRDKSDRCS